MRDASGDFCYLCTPEKKLAEAKKVKVKTDLTLVGKLAGFAIYDLYYHFDPTFPDTKLILVQAGPHQYREIYQRVPTQIDARAMLLDSSPSGAIKSSKQDMLSEENRPIPTIISGLERPNQPSSISDRFWKLQGRCFQHAGLSRGRRVLMRTFPAHITFGGTASRCAGRLE